MIPGSKNADHIKDNLDIDQTPYIVCPIKARVIALFVQKRNHILNIRPQNAIISMHRIRLEVSKMMERLALEQFKAWKDKGKMIIEAYEIFGFIRLLLLLIPVLTV